MMYMQLLRRAVQRKHNPAIVIPHDDLEAKANMSALNRKVVEDSAELLKVRRMCSRPG